jgi:ribosome biogenesis GTPase A
MDYTDKILNEEEKDNLAIAKFKPRQHPRSLQSGDDTGIVSYKVPPKNLTPYHKVPELALVENDDVFGDLSPVGSRSIEAILLGAANAGKSSLLN